MALLPLKDKNPLRIIPFQFVTVAIILACIAVYIYETTLTANRLELLVADFGLVPARLFHRADFCARYAEYCQLPRGTTLLSSMFLHLDWLHLAGNMLFLWIYGDNIEDSMGHVRFLIFYLLCGLAAGLAQCLANTSAMVPAIGASGAIAGILGGYLMLHPRVNILVLVLFAVPVRIPALLVIGLWLSLQIYHVANGGGGGVAWWAHLGGFAAGALLIIPFRNKSIPLFDRGVSH